ncbi:MAG: hypothetical protein ACK56F_08695, partial [bacterium]
TIEATLFDRNGNVIFADATGRFPLASVDGKEYILIMTYKNYIKPIAFANRGADTYVKAFREGIRFFKNLGHNVRSIVLDNETSASLSKLFKDEKLSFQLVPPGIKRSNKAERAIQTFRNHFLAVLGTVPTYGKQTQMAPFDDSPLAPAAAIQRAQEINGVLSHYARVIDYSLLEGVTRLAMTQAQPTADTMT